MKKVVVKTRDKGSLFLRNHAIKFRSKDSFITYSDNKISGFVIFTTYEDIFLTKPLVFRCSVSSATPEAHNDSLYALGATPQARIG
jgi:hypothetical protein